MNAILFPNFSSKDSMEITQKIVDKLISLNVSVYFENEIKEKLSHNSINFINLEDMHDFIFAVVIGGDGTIIKSAKKLLEYGIPLVAVNLGHLGFLSSIEKNELDKLELIVNGEYTIDNRMSICAKIGDKRIVAVNDIVISKNSVSGIINFDIKCSDIETAHYKADGVIFSTPSGSTAYAMSAGGPIVHPSVKAFSFTPICAHSLFARTIILPKDEKVCVKAFANHQKNDVLAVADGVDTVKITENDVIYIQRYEKDAKFIKLKDNEFYYSVNKKLMDRG